MTYTPQAIALNRFGLGARSADILRGDPRGWLIDQIGSPSAKNLPTEKLVSRSQLVDQLRDYREIQARKSARDMDDDTSGKSARRRLRQTYLSAVDLRFSIAIQTDAPFFERLVHFWSNHFAISANKVPVSTLAGDYEFHAIRPNVLGNFSDLLAAAVTHPAMMLYLDQSQSIGPGSTLAKGLTAKQRNAGLNENLAREIMELHTLGVRTGYSQIDVTEFARALTGWTIAGLGRGAKRVRADRPLGEAVFVDAMHEPGERVIMGKRYPEGGSEQSHSILADLAASPATAHHLAVKLARHFISDDPPPAVISRIERAFISGGGDLPTVYRSIVEAPESWEEPGRKFRNPWDWTVAAFRASGIDKLPQEESIAGILKQLGQPVWRPGSPAGWGDMTPDWLGSGALMTRIELAQQIAAGIEGRLDPLDTAHAVFPDTLTNETSKAIAGCKDPSLGFAVLLASPEFLWR